LHSAGEKIEAGAHAVGAWFEDKWLTLKSDVERAAYWFHCKNDRFKKYWKLKMEYEAGKHRELKRLEKEKLEAFIKWTSEHKSDYDSRVSSCGGKNDYDYDQDSHHAEY